MHNEDVVLIVGVEDAPHTEDHSWDMSVCEGCREFPLTIRAALVCGWGAVEREAARWDARATVREVEPRLWVVSIGKGSKGLGIGVIGKEPWTLEELRRRAVALWKD